MAKILISLLGTGKQAKNDNSNNRYETTDYLLDGKLYENLTFSSNVIIKHYNIDKLFFIGTNASMWDNVAEVFEADENYIFEILEKKENKALNENDLSNLNELIDKKLNFIGSKCIIVKDGENEDELWSIFEKFLEILHSLNENDEIYFDITHLFRSVSVMSFIIAELSQIGKNIKFGGMFYGMLKKGEPSKIIDISVFFELLEWVKAIDEIERFASFEKFLKLSDRIVDQKTQNYIKTLDEAFSIANMSAIYNSIKRLKENINSIKSNDDKIFAFILPRIEKFINELTAKSLSDFQFKIANFFAKRGMYSIAYIALAEAVISYICEKEGYSIDSEDDRKKAKNIISSYLKSGGNRQKLNKIFFKQINRIRNNIAHQLNTTKQPKDDIKNFDKYFKESKEYLKNIFN